MPLSSTDSSPLSFYTAKDSGQDESTAASSPIHGRPCPYRDTRQLPRELKDHCQIFLEEQLYTCAVNLLSSILGSGASRPTPAGKPISIPPPSHLALLNTLIVHPAHTTRAEKPDHIEVSSLALCYLRSLLTVAGPLNADLRAAFQFRPPSRWTRQSGFRGGSNANDSDFSDDDLERDEETLQGKMANESGLWMRGQDFWSTVGWAFNCSTLYPQRWRYWKAWLEYMLDVLEADWVERERRDIETYEANAKTGDIPETSRRGSIITMYMEQQTGRHNGSRSIIKALLADGNDISSSAFPEVFEKELKGPRKNPKKRKREQVLDLENDQFGDYFEEESFSSGVSEPPTPEKQREEKKNATFGSANLGLVESINLRLRLMNLLSAVTDALHGPSEYNKLYDDFAAAVKLLPLRTFSLIVTQRQSPFVAENHITVMKELFHLFLPLSYKDPRKIDKEADLEGKLTALMLEHCYAPYPANTAGFEDNAKLSLLVESAMQMLWSNDLLEYSSSFAQAMETGIKAREQKAKKKRTGKGRSDAGDRVAEEVLTNSAKRIRTLLQVVEASAAHDEEE
ncbi:hypothetical protein HJFPF1_02940 [Paramyrothecium foliicola]|nr:hypothetical protein HJFPF1_02940 [Paramyrothecium foliicola]